MFHGLQLYVCMLQLNWPFLSLCVCLSLSPAFPSIWGSGAGYWGVFADEGHCQCHRTQCAADQSRGCGEGGPWQRGRGKFRIDMRPTKLSSSFLSFPFLSFSSLFFIFSPPASFLLSFSLSLLFLFYLVTLLFHPLPVLPTFLLSPTVQPQHSANDVHSTQTDGVSSVCKTKGDCYHDRQCCEFTLNFNSLGDKVISESR